jgi:hypothetical protein
MVLTDVITLVSLISLGGIIGLAGFMRILRLDRLRWQQMRQNACQWHRWESTEGGTTLACTLCGKKSRRLNPARDRDVDPASPGNLLP